MLPQRIADLLSRWGRRAYPRIFRRDLDVDFKRLDACDTLALSAREMSQKMRCVSVLLSPNDRQPPSIPEAGSWAYDELFILGSGSSLLTLSERERQTLNELPTIAMNRYLLYWDMLGIWPKYAYLADIHAPTPEVLTRIVEMIGKNPHRPAPQLLLASDYQQWPLAPLRPILFGRHHDAPAGEDHPWAKSLAESMYFHRGSLTCLLNLVTVLRLAPKVCLLGVDLADGKAFYADRYENDLDLHDHWETLRRDTGIHPTALDYKGIPPIQAKLPWVFEQMKQVGVSVSCYSESSLLVKDGLCPLRAPLSA